MTVAVKGTDAVERGGEGDEAVAADAPVGGQQADDAAEGCGLADGAAGVGAERGRAEAGGDRGCASAGRASGHAVERARVADGAVGGVLVRAAHGELVAVELGEEHGARGFEPGDGGGVVGGAVAGEDA